MRMLLILIALFALASHLTLAAAPVEKGAQEFAAGYDLLKQQKYQEARTTFEAGLQQNPANAMAHFYLGDACRGLKAWACAEEHYETSIELDANSTVIELAKQRLRKAKVWRRLEEGKRIINNANTTDDQAKQAAEHLDIANKLGLDDEQSAIYAHLREKIDSRMQRETQRLAAAENQATVIKQRELLRKLEGKWRFVNGQGVYQAQVNEAGGLEMRVVVPTRDMMTNGMKSGDVAFSNFTKVESINGSPPTLVWDRFMKDAAVVMEGRWLIAYDLKPESRRETLACPSGIQGIKEHAAALTYIPSSDRIRVLQYTAPYFGLVCQIGTGDWGSTGWQEALSEMIRQ